MMRSMFRIALVLFVLLGSWPAPAVAQPDANLDTTADAVFGQGDNFTTAGFASSDSALANPNSIAIDSNGNVYIADSSNHRVLEYTSPLGTNRIADKVFGQANFTDHSANRGSGVPSASSLSSPRGVALDSQGNLYVADFGNNRVLVFNDPLNTDGVADQVFGQPDFISASANNGGVSNHSLNRPYAVALDLSDNLYVADFNNNRVLRYNAPVKTHEFLADIVVGQPDFSLTIANKTAASLSGPTGLAVDATGNLFVADGLNNRVLKYTAPLQMPIFASLVLGQAAFGTNAPATTQTGLFLPIGLALDVHGGLYVADRYNNRVLRYASPQTNGQNAGMLFGQLNYTSNLPNRGSPNPSATSLSTPWGVAVDPHGNLFIADSDNQRVLEYEVPVAHTAPVLNALSPTVAVAGGPGFTLTVNGTGFVQGALVQWNGISNLTVYLNSTQLIALIPAVEVASGGPFAVSVLNPAPGGGSSSFINFTLYTRSRFDRAADEVFGQPDFTSRVADNPLMPSGANRLNILYGLAIDPQNSRIFVSDVFNNRVLSWPNAAARANGQSADLVIGQPNFYSTVPNAGGSVSKYGLSHPRGLAVDGSGNLYVADQLNNRVLVFKPPFSNGKGASYVFGQGGSFTSSNSNNGGIGPNSLNFVTSVAVDALGNVYITDYGNNRVLEYNTPLVSGVTADRVIGQADFTGMAPNRGALPTASGLYEPADLLVDPHGNLFVSDSANHRVLEFFSPLTDQTADIVIGQDNFSTRLWNQDGSLNAKPTSLFIPIGLAMDSSGSLYVADSNNVRVLKYTAPFTTGAAALLAYGQPDLYSSATNNGGISAESLGMPIGLAVDASDHLFVADGGNHRVLEYDTYWAKTMLPLIRR